MEDGQGDGGGIWIGPQGKAIQVPHEGDFIEILAKAGILPPEAYDDSGVWETSHYYSEVFEKGFIYVNPKGYDGFQIVLYAENVTDQALKALFGYLKQNENRIGKIIFATDEDFQFRWTLNNASEAIEFIRKKVAEIR